MVSSCCLSTVVIDVGCAYCGGCGNYLSVAPPSDPCAVAPQEWYDARLAAILDEQPASHLLSIAGVYALLAEHYNADILNDWDAELTEDR